jgi:hypothetical protein
VALIEGDYVIEKILAAAPDPAFGHAVLPGAAKGSARWLAAHGANRGHDLRAELGIAIKGRS